MSSSTEYMPAGLSSGHINLDWAVNTLASRTTTKCQGTGSSADRSS